MNLLEVANKRAVPGILIFNNSEEPVFINPVALGILAQANGSSVTGAARNPAKKKPLKAPDFGVALPQEISNLYDSLKKNFLAGSFDFGSGSQPQISIFSTIESTYCCRGFSLQGNEQSFHIMMLIEKISKNRQVNMENLKKRCHSGCLLSRNPY